MPGRDAVLPTGILTAVEELMFVTPRPLGAKLMSPFEFVAVTVLPLKFKLSMSAEPVMSKSPVKTKLFVDVLNVKFAESTNSPDVPANVTRPDVKSSTFNEARVDWPSTFNVPTICVLPLA